MYKFTFEKLRTEHFSFLLVWLSQPHVKKYWDHQISWTNVLIREKYTDYVAGYKRVIMNGVPVKKPIYAFVILCEGVAIGYIQAYLVSDFALEADFSQEPLPQKCASFDWYIGDPEYVGKGIGTKVLEIFLDKHIFTTCDVCVVSADLSNKVAVRVYEKAGFRKLNGNRSKVLLIKNNAPNKERIIFK